MMDYGVELQAAKLGQIGRFVRTRQDDDALVDSRGAQTQTIAKRGHAKRIGIGQRTCDAFQPVTVAIRLDYGHYARRARTRAHSGEVAAQRTEVDRGDGRAAHACNELEFTDSCRALPTQCS